MACVAERSEEAFSLLMRRHMGPMLSLAKHVVLNVPEAHEIVQEAFLRVWKTAPQWDPEGPALFSTWLHRVVLNLAISGRRRHKPEMGLEALENFSSEEKDGFEKISEAGRRAMVRKALSDLPEKQRAAIALYYFEDLPQKEASSALGLSPKAFESLLARAREKLRKEFSSRLRWEDV